MTILLETFDSELILAEIKENKLRKRIIDVDEERTKVVIFSCGAYLFAFQGAEIKEILQPCEISWLPGLPGYIPGLINVRGDIESVIAISHFLGSGSADPGECLIALAVKDAFRSGILIDAVHDVIDIAPRTIMDPLPSVCGPGRGLAAGQFAYNGETVTLIDMGRLAAMVSV